MVAVAGTDTAAAPLLLLFDIDGTLLSGATAAHSEALHEALRQVHGVDTRATSGRDRPGGAHRRGDRAAAAAQRRGLGPRHRRGRDGGPRACGEVFARLCPPSLADTVIPGIAELVSWLDGRDDVRLSLVTGNYEPVARLKLSRAGIGRHFPSGQGGFGSDSEDRAALPGIARKRAGHDGVSHPRRRAIVIGDTPRDIACAQADDVRCFAVTTGPVRGGRADRRRWGGRGRRSRCAS